MSAFRGKADMTVCRCLLSRSLLGVKRTCRVALHMSAFDPKRTSCRGAKYRNLHRIGLAVNRPGGEMQRRGESVRPAKGRRTIRRKARKAPTAGVYTTDIQEQVTVLTHELKEAREQLS